MDNIIKNTFPFWEFLSKSEQDELLKKALLINHKKGTVLYHSVSECTGIMIVKHGIARVFTTSPNGGEITLYRLLDGDVCILSAACMIKNLNFEVNMEIEEDTDFIIIPKDIYQKISDAHTQVKDYTLNILSEKFSDVMWVFNQFVFSNVAKRLADSLLEHRALSGSDEFKITHEALAKDLGTAREVVTRLLKQFQLDNIVALSRGKIKILDAKKLSKI